MAQVDKILEWAYAQIGTAEDPPGSNNIVYNTEYYGRAVSGDRYMWCMSFVWCGFHDTEMSDLFYGGKKTASCTTLMNWAKSVGQFVDRGYQKGDVFFYDNDGVKTDSEHTGIYTGERSGERYKVIEGNYADKVCLVQRKPESIIGAFRPKWEEKKTDTALMADGIDLPEVRYGDIGATVKAVQILLMGWGYKLPRYGADGEYGAETRTALLAYQKEKGLTADGICGAKTWRKLLGLQ